MVIAARESSQDAVALSNAFLACVWEAEQDISDPTVLVAAANQAGFDGETLGEKINDDDIVRIHQSNTDEAIEREVFGMPWFIHDGTSYWGQDRISFLEKALLT